MFEFIGERLIQKRTFHELYHHCYVNYHLTSMIKLHIFFCFTVIFALARPFQAFENVFQRNKFCFMQMFHKQQAFQLDQVLHHHWHQCEQTWFHSSSLQPSQLEQQRKLRFGQNFVQTQSWGSVSVASFHHMLEVSHSMRLENWKQTVKAKRKVSLCNHQISDSLSLYALYF